MSKIKFVFIDIDDTLFDFHRSEAVALSYTLESLGIDPTEETLSRYSRINKSLWQALERGEIERDRLLTKRYELLFEEISAKADARVAQSLYEGKLSKTYYYLDGAEELLSHLKKNYKVYLASNGTAIVQDGRIARSGIGKYADGIFISERVGYNKPSREFFESCFSSIEGFDKEFAVMIGDSLSSDILGGINAGIKTCFYNPASIPIPPDIRPDAEAKSLGDIPAILERL